jgi:hypothetical protein
MDRSKSAEILTERDNNCGKNTQLWYEICCNGLLFIYLFIEEDQIFQGEGEK